MEKLKQIFLNLPKNLRVWLIILIAILTLIFISFVTKAVLQTRDVKETRGKLAKITQAYVSISASGYDSTGGDKDDTAIIQYSPLINISTTKEISKFEILNVRLANKISAQKSFITWPKHYGTGQSSNTFYEPMGTKTDYQNRKDEGKSFSYNVVDVVRYTDEIGKNGGYVDFKLTLYGLGKKFDHEGILNTDKVYSSGKVLTYAGLKESDISSPIEFDVVITFTDKTKAVKHFSLSSNFGEILSQGFSFKYNSSDYEGKEF